LPLQVKKVTIKTIRQELKITISIVFESTFNCPVFYRIKSELLLHKPPPLSCKLALSSQVCFFQSYGYSLTHISQEGFLDSADKSTGHPVKNEFQIHNE
jgi:hypothetical protein